MKEEIPVSDNVKSRRKLLTGLGIFSIFSFLRIFRVRKPPEVIDCGPAVSKETKKLLTQDGQLVEVDVSKIRMLQKKISNEELQGWIKKNKL
jgi:hypothetical protein